MPQYTPQQRHTLCQLRAPNSPAHIPAPGAVCRNCAHVIELAGTSHFSQRAYCKTFSNTTVPTLCKNARMHHAMCGSGRHFVAARMPGYYTEAQARAYLNTAHVKREADNRESDWVAAEEAA